jgi:hypothetical protein
MVRVQIGLAVVFAACCNAALGDIVIDQQFTVTPGNALSYYLDYAGDHMAQTFTVRHSGTLAGIDIQVALSPDSYGPAQPPIDDLHVKVVRTDSDGFAVMTEVLAEATVAPSRLPVAIPFGPSALTHVNLLDWHAQIWAGEKLAITLSSNQTDHSGPEYGTNYIWWRKLYNPHPGGEYSTYSPKLYGPKPLRDILRGVSEPTVDAGFRVYVNVVPEPSVFALASLGAFGAIMLQRSKSCVYMQATSNAA